MGNERTIDGSAEVHVQGSRMGALLKANAVYSGLAGAVLMSGAQSLSESFGVDAWLLTGIGVALGGWVALLLWGAAHPGRAHRVGAVAAAGDVTWVIGAVIVIAIPDAMTGTGKAALAAATVGVAAFAIAQTSAFRRTPTPS